MRHWPDDGASDLEQELIELMREDGPEPPEGAQEQVFLALSAHLGLGAANVATSAGATQATGSAVAATTKTAGAATLATGGSVTTAAGGGVLKLLVVGLVLGGATAGVGHLVSSPGANSQSGGEEQRSVSGSQPTAPQAPTPQVKPRGNVAASEPGGEAPAAGAPRGVAGRGSRSDRTGSAEIEGAASDLDVAPGPSVARFAESEPLAAPSSEGTSASQLDAEREALAAARQALKAGNPSRSLALLTQLNQRYPKLKLSQEHEALSIRALAASGAKAQAVTRARRFVELYPNSPLTPGVREVLR
ncbi:MAG: hypothetical protein H6718_32200 [Polyangiaceae bacterium]|nr:hypothetical protein [Polyangiaceae bacterium]MCB9608000.1 hypothetical protein [Polyangiaceae bacterium]